MSQAVQQRKWWKEAVVYQIYPMSFCDANGDGLGDIPGIISKVPYLKALGIDVIWLSPFFKSPQKDFGYDISDYRDIYEPYGTLDDMDKLIKTVHEHGLKIVADGVYNHTSNEHAWFKESASSKENPKRDWYIWRKGKEGKDGKKLPPNNWRSVFGAGSAWTYDEKTDEWYLRLFVSEQPDLNWNNPEVREAIWDTMRFWLDRGMDGFRLDVINLIAKADDLPDAPITQPDQEYQYGYMYTASQPKVHDYLKEMRQKVLSKYDCFTVGETPFTYDPEILAGYTRGDQLDMIYHFELFDLDAGSAASPMEAGKWKLTDYKKIWAKWQKPLNEGGWIASTMSNHDQARAISRLASDEPQWRALSGKMLATLLTTMGGTTYVYEGEDIGLINVPREWGLDEYKDVATIQYIEGVREARRKATGESDPDVSDQLQHLRQKARDNARTPMQWDTSKNAGFSSADKTWMSVHPDYKEWNVEVQRKDRESLNNFWTKLFKMRKENLLFVYGTYEHVDFDNEDVFAYVREHEGQKALVCLNFKDRESTVALPSGLDVSSARQLIGNYGEKKPASGKVELKPFEGVVYLL